MLNTSLTDAGKNVQILFKSSPFGTQSHGYDAQNSFLLYAFGRRLLIRSGRRDIHGSKHHREWMWHTKSANSITVNGQSQIRNSVRAVGEILDFHTSEPFDYVAGEAGRAYGDLMKRFTRCILFVKPELVVIFDRLEAPKAGTFEWHLHAPTRMTVGGQDDVGVASADAACRISFLAPAGLKLSQTDKFDPPPRPRVKLVEYHLTAETPHPARTTHFVTLLRPHRKGKAPPTGAELKPIPGGLALTAELAAGQKAVVLLRLNDGARLRAAGLTAEADVAACVLDSNGKRIEVFRAE